MLGSFEQSRRTFNYYKYHNKLIANLFSAMYFYIRVIGLGRKIPWVELKLKINNDNLILYSLHGGEKGNLFDQL